MIKNFIYVGLLLIAISIIAFLAASASLSGSMMGNLPTVNVTVPRNGFTYALVNTSDATTAIVSAVASSAINVYIFNASAFSLWQRHMAGNASVNGLQYAKTIYPGNSTFISASTTLVMPENGSAVLPKGALFNNSVYVVLDNTNDSPSSGNTVNARVVYLILDSATTTRYHMLASNQTYVGVAALVLFIAGVVLAIYGIVKKEPQSSAVQVPTSKKAADKEYIDSLYKNVDNKKAGKKKRRDGSSK